MSQNPWHPLTVADAGPLPKAKGDDRPTSVCFARIAKAFLNLCPERIGRPYECPDPIRHYDGIFDEFRLIIHDGGRSSLMIASCPFCGAKLPESNRDVRFDAVEALGFEYPSSMVPERVPVHLRNPGWWAQGEGAIVWMNASQPPPATGQEEHR